MHNEEEPVLYKMLLTMKASKEVSDEFQNILQEFKDAKDDDCENAEGKRRALFHEKIKNLLGGFQLEVEDNQFKVTQP